ncbi:hypothetical protein T12_4243 [Trichinella patagoniensis]|uniref:Uncharacterized protein n=1 Tax=Trichinella patagoniensis TaxID=990121 RepID=A0A0V0ZLX7_9BILA|nr:hypothetical protein T12_4243 [Trichinella patagoniensis]
MSPHILCQMEETPVQADVWKSSSYGIEDCHICHIYQTVKRPVPKVERPTQCMITLFLHEYLFNNDLLLAKQSIKTKNSISICKPVPKSPKFSDVASELGKLEGR